MYKYFIERPVVAIVIAIFMVILGAVTAAGLPIAQFPDIVPPEILVKAFYTGADALTVEQAVATPIEQQMSGVDNMAYMSSINSSNGSMQLTVDFEIGSNPNTDQILSQMRQAQAASQLPLDVNTIGVTVQKSNAAPLMLVDLDSGDGRYDANFLANYAVININDQLMRVPGVGSVTVFGSGQYAMRIWIKPDQLAKMGITVPEIAGAIQAQNTVNPAGQLGGEPSPAGQEFTYSVRTDGRLNSEKEFAEIAVRINSDGSVVRLKDVARIELGSQTYSVVGHLDGKPSAVIGIYQAPGSNALQTAAGVRKLFEEAAKRFPPGLRYTIALDSTAPVRAGIREIVQTLLEALFLVAVVVFLFLQSWRATLIPLLAVPVSLIGVFVLFPLLGFSINTLSLFGLVLAIGLVVDDAIVVVEAVEHHIELGLSPKEASMAAMKEVSAPVIGIAIVLAAVFVPTAFIPGITGRLYQQFAVTIAVSVVLSAFNALTLSPALAALLLKPRKKSSGPLGKFFGWFNRGFDNISNQYVRGCGFLLRKTFATLLILGAFGLMGFGLGSKVPSGFLPQEDQGYLFVGLQLPDAASLQRTLSASAKVEQTLKQTPGVEHVTSIVGYNMVSRVTNSYSAFFYVTLKDWDERTRPDEQLDAINAHINRALSGLPEGVAFSFAPPAIPGVGAAGGFTFMLEDRSGGDVQFLAGNLNKYMQAARKRPELAGLYTTFLPAVPQLSVQVDRDKVLRQQISLTDVYRTLQTFMGGAFINYFNRFGRQWPVYVQAEGEYRTRPADIDQFYVRNASGVVAPLSALTTIQPTTGPEFTVRYNLYRTAQINGGAAPGYSSAQAMKALEEVFAETMPAEMGFDYSGMSYQEQQSQKGIPPAVIFGFSILFVFLILAALYNNWKLPFSVLLSTPIAVFGAYAGLYARRLESLSFENNVYAQIGLVMLIGLAAKNAILIVEFAKTGYERGMPLREAALEAARLRLRPILMTSMAFILGCVPLWIATGAGAVSRQTLGTIVIAGMLAVTFLSVFLIPALFYIVESVGGARGPEPATPSIAAAQQGEV